VLKKKESARTGVERTGERPQSSKRAGSDRAGKGVRNMEPPRSRRWTAPA
jgi:hypothetical protein